MSRDIYCPKCGQYDSKSDAELFCHRCNVEKKVYKHVKHKPHVFQTRQAPMVIPDIQPYKSTATGEVIQSRSKHRDHLKRHNLVELGNDMPKVKPIPKIGNTKQDLVETCRRLKVKGFH